MVTADTAFFLHGISAGTAVTVTALSKWDRRRVAEPEKPTPAIVASLDLTPGYDISKVLLRERFLWPYNDLLMQGVKDHFVVNNEELLRAHDSGTVDRLLNATSLQEIVDIGVIFAGYENTTQYYEDSNPINALKDILTPKLVLNAVDDVSVKSTALPLFVNVSLLTTSICPNIFSLAATSRTCTSNRRTLNMKARPLLK